ncbi:MAG TPA: electron transfer flavoprotein subunit beta/FixA family protein [Anaerolineae bacterium]|nr:electron transfer flavoprotein subunit beta/FixA family protein [Anaerolineae bacterium]
MRIIVPIKQILDPRGITFRRDKERMFINREEYIMGMSSRAAIEAALRLKDAMGGEVVALCMGKPQAEDALREALAVGCDAAYLLSDKAFREADISVTVRILAAAVGKLGGADLIVTGRESSDTGAGQIGPRLAEALGYAQVTDAYLLAVEDGTLQATRRWGNNYAAVQIQLPAVATVAPEAFPLRYAHGARIMSAYRDWEVPVWDAAELGLGEATLVPLLAFRREGFPSPMEVGEVFGGDASSVAQDVVMALKLQKLVG